MNKIHIHGGDIYRYPGVLDFSSNCNPWGTPERVKRAAADAMEQICHYPDVESQKLREALEKAEGVPVENIVCGNGAADLIFGLTLAKKPKKALLLAPTFAEYEQALRSVGSEIVYFYLEEADGFHVPEALLNEITEDIDMMFFCNPNNPTGVLTERDFIKKLAARCKEKGVFLVLDECFTDFVEKPEACSMKPYMEEFSNMFLVKAFTKKYAMAGLRLGYGLCKNEEFLKKMRAVMQPWNVSAPAQAAGIAALAEEEYVRSSMEKLKEERAYLLKELEKTGLKIYDSRANYIFFQGPENFWQDCMKQGVLIRDCSNYVGLCKGFYRIAVRTREENEKLIKVFTTLLI